MSEGKCAVYGSISERTLPESFAYWGHRIETILPFAPISALITGVQ